jgi:hypothetical protein
MEEKLNHTGSSPVLTTWERSIPKLEHGSQTRKPKYLYSGE